MSCASLCIYQLYPHFSQKLYTEKKYKYIYGRKARLSKSGYVRAHPSIWLHGHWRHWRPPTAPQVTGTGAGCSLIRPWTSRHCMVLAAVSGANFRLEKMRRRRRGEKIEMARKAHVSWWLGTANGISPKFPSRSDNTYCLELNLAVRRRRQGTQVKALHCNLQFVLPFPTGGGAVAAVPFRIISIEANRDGDRRHGRHEWESEPYHREGGSSVMPCIIIN